MELALDLGAAVFSLAPRYHKRRHGAENGAERTKDFWCKCKNSACCEWQAESGLLVNGIGNHDFEKGWLRKNLHPFFCCRQVCSSEGTVANLFMLVKVRQMDIPCKNILLENYLSHKRIQLV